MDSGSPLNYFGWNFPEYILLSLSDVNGHSQLAGDALSVLITQGIIIVPRSGSGIEFFGELHRDFSVMT